MKKYITILSIATVLFSRSCERSDPSYLSSDREKHHETVHQCDSGSPATGQPSPPSTPFTPGGDDEPDKDKQHWRSNGGGDQ